MSSRDGKDEHDVTSPHGRRPRVVVVGGGISGLAAAWHLTDPARTGPGRPEVVVLEGSPRVGGILRTGELGHLRIDVGAESVLARRPEAVELMTEAGLADEVVHPATTAANVVVDGVLRPLPGGTLMGVPGDPGTLRGFLADADVARAAAEPDVPPTDVGDDVAVGPYVASRVGRAVVDRLVEPLLGGVYAGHADELSLRATVPQLYAAASRGGSLLAAVRQLRSVPLAGGGHGVHAPGGGALDPADVGAPPVLPVFAGLRGGVGRLPQVLATGLAARGATVRTGATVRGLERTATGWRLTVGPASDPETLDADAVVLAVPAAPAARLLAAAAPAAARRLAGVETASVGVVGLLLPRDQVVGLPGSGVLVPPVEGRTVKAMTFSARKWAWTDALDPDHVVVRLSVGRHHEEAVLQRDDADLARAAVADAGAVLGRPLAPVATTVVRWGGALPQPAVGHVGLVTAARDDVETLPGLAVCGAAFDGVGVPACVAAARRAAAKVAADLAATPAPA